MIPALSHPLIGLSHVAASATSLSALSLSAVSGAISFGCEGAVDVPTALAIGLPSVAGVRFGVLLARSLSNETNRIIFDVLSTLMLPTHMIIQRRRASDGEAKPVTSWSEERHGVVALASHGLYGVVSGSVSALMGVGGLPLAISYLTLATGMPHHLVQGTAMCSVVPGVVASSLSHLNAGSVSVMSCILLRISDATLQVKVAASAAVGSTLGAYAGARLALQLSEDDLRSLYCLSLIVLGGRSAFGAAHAILRRLFPPNR